MVTKKTTKSTARKGRFSKTREERRAKARAGAQKEMGDNTKKLLNNTKGLEVWYPKEAGTYTFKVLPYLQTTTYHPDHDTVDLGEDYWFRRPYGIHWYDKKPMICPRLSAGEDCPMCDEMFEQYKQRKQYDKKTPEWTAHDEMAKALKPKENCLYIIEFEGQTDPEVEDGRYIFDWSIAKFTKYLKQKLEKTSALNDKDPDKYPDYSLFYDFEDGYSIEMEVDLVEGGMPYIGCETHKDINFVEREDLDEDIVDEVPSLDDVLTIPTAEEVQAFFDGVSLESSEEKEMPPFDDSDVDEGKSAKKTRPKRSDKKASKKKEVIEEVEEEDEEFPDKEIIEEEKIVEEDTQEDLEYDDPDEEIEDDEFSDDDLDWGDEDED